MAVILYSGFPLKKAATRVSVVKVTLYFHENLIFKSTKNRRVNIQKTLRFKTNSKIQYMVRNINQAKMKKLAERERFVIDNNSKRDKKREKKT